MKEPRVTDVAKLIKMILLLAVAISVLFLVGRHFLNRRDKEREKTNIVASSKLEKVLQISELSTYQVAFNGVADVKDDDGQVLYHTAYEAKVSIGLEMEKVKVTVEDTAKENKKIVVVLPAIEITDVDVDLGSLDYIFKKESANTSDVSIAAIPACRKDAEEECRANDMLFELARENAENTIKALMQPFLGQQEGYALEIAWEGRDGHEG